MISEKIFKKKIMSLNQICHDFTNDLWHKNLNASSLIYGVPLKQIKQTCCPTSFMYDSTAFVAMLLPLKANAVFSGWLMIRDFQYLMYGFKKDLRY